jgi:hypothetical protein
MYQNHQNQTAFDPKTVAFQGWLLNNRSAKRANIGRFAGILFLQRDLFVIG